MDTAAFRDAVGDLLAEAEGELDEATMAAVLTAYTAQLRGRVRLPLDARPGEARALREGMVDHVGDTMEVELVVTDEVLAELDLQLRTFE